MPLRSARARTRPHTALRQSSSQGLAQRAPPHPVRAPGPPIGLLLSLLPGSEPGPLPPSAPPSKVRSSPGSSGLKRLYFQGLRNLHLQGLLPQGCRSVPATFATTPKFRTSLCDSLHACARPSCRHLGARRLPGPGRQTKAAASLSPFLLTLRLLHHGPKADPQNAADP